MADARLPPEDNAESEADGGVLGPNDHEGTPGDGLKATRNHVKVWVEPAIQGALDGVRGPDWQSL